MECSICFDNITKETGKAELSCSHVFHLKCLSNWFNKNENCPCCRHEANDMEKMGHLESVEEEDDYTDDEEYSDDDTDEEDDEEDEIELNAAKERARHSFRLKLSSMTEVERKEYAASRISALVRGYQSRMVVFELKCSRERERETISDIKEFEKDLIAIRASIGFHRKLAVMTPPQRKMFAATKIQSYWKAKKQQKVYNTMRHLDYLLNSLIIEVNPETSIRRVERVYDYSLLPTTGFACSVFPLYPITPKIE